MNASTAQVERILADPDIGNFLDTHRGAAKEITAAIEQLAEKPDARIAIKKLRPALAAKTVYVFFSYKKKDERAAVAVVNALRKFSAGKLRISYQADFTEEIAGKQWRDKIRDEVCRANWFILLLPDPSDDWDWCLYETGIFDRQPTSADRLICLHHPDTKIPSPIEDYHSVPATIPEVEKFLRMVYLNSNPVPGMKAINTSIEDDIPTIAEEIVEAIRPPRKGIVHQTFEPFVNLKIDNAAKLEDKEGLDDAVLLQANAQALDAFGFIQRPATWGELRSGIQEHGGDGRWREELFHVVRKVAQGRKFYPIQAVFHTSDGKTYRPLLNAVDRTGSRGPINSFNLIFSEEVGVLNSTSMPEEVSTLVTLLRMTFRFRWEVLEKYGKRDLSEDDIERIENAILRMEVEAESRGIVDQEAVTRIFQPSDADRLNAMFSHWATLRNRSDGSGILDVAIANKDKETISKLLREMIPMNQEFLELATGRFSALVAGMT